MNKDSGEQRQEGAPAKPVRSNTKAPSEVTWTASEYIAHHKGFGWYILLGAAGLGLAALVFLLTRDIISTAAVLIVTIIFATAGGFKPRVLTYRLDATGLTVGKKFYPYSTFKSFVLVQEGAFPSITLMPLKRFMPSISIYFAPDDQDKIIEVLSGHLPLNQSQGEFVDHIMHRIRF